MKSLQIELPSIPGCIVKIAFIDIVVTFRRVVLDFIVNFFTGTEPFLNFIALFLRKTGLMFFSSFNILREMTLILFCNIRTIGWSL